jgi:hypothetical protein
LNFRQGISSRGKKSLQVTRLGVAIAEARETAGDPARHIVRSSLADALIHVKSLGLSSRELTNIIAMIDQGAPMDIYGQVTFLRGKFQLLL